MVVVGLKKKILDGCVAKIAPNGWQLTDKLGLNSTNFKHFKNYV